MQNYGLTYYIYYRNVCLNGHACASHKEWHGELSYVSRLGNHIFGSKVTYLADNVWAIKLLTVDTPINA